MMRVPLKPGKDLFYLEKKIKRRIHFMVYGNVRSGEDHFDHFSGG